MPLVNIYKPNNCLYKDDFNIIGAKSSAISNPPMSKDNSPILTTSKTTRYVRASKSLNPNTASMASAKETTDVGNTSLTGSVGSTSPIWKHSLSASGQITPPNVALGVKGKVESVPVAGTSSAQQHAGVEKEKVRTKFIEGQSVFATLNL